jgi:large subunit ribosomal protein L39e
MMSKSKSGARKKHLGKELKKNRRIPVFVIAKTNRKVSQNTKRRNWRRNKLKLKIK